MRTVLNVILGACASALLLLVIVQVLALVFVGGCNEGPALVLQPDFATEACDADPPGACDPDAARPTLDMRRPADLVRP